MIHTLHPQAKIDAKKVLTKSLEVDPYYTPSIALMAEILHEGGESHEAILLLNKYLSRYADFKLYTILGEIMASINEPQAALDAFTTALR